MVIHLPNLGLPESMLEQADNAEYQAKCQSCGDMFQLDSLDPEDIAVCPMCQQSVRLGDAVILGCSNEDYDRARRLLQISPSQNGTSPQIEQQKKRGGNPAFLNRNLAIFVFRWFN